MIKLLYILLTPQRQESKLIRKTGGFTLIELLVAVILAALVITPLLGFMINIMTTDRQEQAKTNSEQEIQAALDYINRDVQQAVYIYDKAGVDAIKDEIPQSTDKTPVLVFWKRKLIEKSNPVTGDNCTNGCNDAFVYSLVAYYLIKDNSTTWSQAARIGRFEIHDGVRNAEGAPVSVDPPRTDRDNNFKPFDLTDGETLAEKLSKWENNGDGYENDQLPENNILVDYIDQTNTSDNSSLPSEACPDTAVGADPGWTQVPDYTTLSADTFKTYSFYACVYSSKNTARVFIRGNALARIEKDANRSKYTAQKSAYFPRARVEVKGIGVLSND